MQIEENKEINKPNITRHVVVGEKMAACPGVGDRRSHIIRSDLS